MWYHGRMVTRSADSPIGCPIRRWLLLGLFLLAFALRLYQLGADSLWYDETVSVYLAHQPIPELIRHTAGDIHPPGYYLLLWGWGRLAGWNGFSVGFLSAWWGMLLLPLVYVLARRVYNEQVAWVAVMLSAISPYGVWYSQEVRMYTLGAALGLICLYATMRILSAPRSSARHVAHLFVVFVAAATAGLYALYYFAFLLIAINLWAIARLLRENLLSRRTVIWLAAQLVVLILYAPWLPIAWRQATDPPVPPWREFTPFWPMLRESLSALAFGQSVPVERVGLALAIVVALYAVGLLRARHPWSTLALAVHTFVPLLFIHLISVLVTPLYHVRYVFTYAPPFVIVVAAGLVRLWRSRRRWQWSGQGSAVLGAGLIIAVSVVSLHAFWTDPRYTADDHRGAVRFLSQHWRPGDAILVNAGYAYTALLTYWDQPVTWRGRLSNYPPQVAAETVNTPGAVIVQTGHIDGAPDLGWGDPRSDFYALPHEVAVQRLEQLFAAHPRIWHYRIYDTVNDPGGFLRGELDRLGERFEDRVFAGEANLRVQGFLPRQRGIVDASGLATVTFTDRLELLTEPVSATIASGDLLDHAVFWRVRGEHPLPRDYATSIRLVGPHGRIWSQPADERPLGSLYGSSHWRPGQVERQPLRLPIPPGTPPGEYTVELVIYDPSTGIPLPVTELPGTDAISVADGSRIRLGQVHIVRPATPPSWTRRPLARFDDIELLNYDAPVHDVAPGSHLPVELLWRHRSSADKDNYVVVLQLLGEGDRLIANHEALPVDGRYPSGAWVAGELVRDKHDVGVPSDAPPGTYRLVLALDRADARQRIQVRLGFWPWQRADYMVLGHVRVIPTEG
ncbi:MAG TPA: hypothetical protein EYH31_07920 [Anaerolineae bacterium]|nr:hypothetical protein [Anaerolineae bacterium]